MSAHAYVDPPIQFELEATHTHQCEFTRGYWMGVAQTEAAYRPRSAFRLRLPTRYIEDLRRVLVARRVVELEKDRNRFCVEFTTVRVEPL